MQAMRSAPLSPHGRQPEAGRGRALPIRLIQTVYMARSQWGSRLGFILAAAGSAIGLGAIWKFPYVAAQNGGGAFLLIFLAFVFTLGVTLMMAEMADAGLLLTVLGVARSVFMHAESRRYIP